jgi:hypothetical protein
VDIERRQKRFLDLLLVAILLIGGIGYQGRREPPAPELVKPPPIYSTATLSDFDWALCSRHGPEPHPPRGYGAGCFNRDDRDIGLLGKRSSP